MGDRKPVVNRRAFLATIGALANGLGFARRSAGQHAGTKLILLGTGGGPRPRKASSAPAQVIANDTAYVVDCGNGVARQLVFAGVALDKVRNIFLTHHHSDHNADYGNLIWLAWTAGLRTRVDTWGPPPLESMTKRFFEMNGYDIKTRIADEGRTPLIPLVKVTAALVNHPPIVPAFGYRFEAYALQEQRVAYVAPTEGRSFRSEHR
jgi:ribonuclease BN (tRNA processing enzyme)